MLKTIKLKKLGKKIGITRWNDVELLTGYDTGGYYVDIAQSEKDVDVDIICTNIFTSENKVKNRKMFLKYEKTLKHIQKNSYKNNVKRRTVNEENSGSL